MTSTSAFDPRPLRVAVVVAVLFLAGPGSVLGASMLWTFGGGAPFVPLVMPSTHALLQLAGGFMTLILAFLALGVPYVLGLVAARARFVLVPIFVVAAALLLEVGGSYAGSVPVMLAGRCAGTVGALLAFALLAVIARDKTARPRTDPPAPVLLACLALFPVAWALAALDVAGIRIGIGSGIGIGDVAGDAMLLAVVVPIVMSMGFKMFSAMLQIDAGSAPRFTAAAVAWLAGGALLALAHLGVVAAVGAGLCCAGAVLWLASLHWLKRKKRGLTLAATAGSELRVHVVVAATALIAGPGLWLAAAVRRDQALADVARHTLALGFVMNVTIGVTLRALPRFCRGRPSSPRLQLATLALLVLGLVLRFGLAVPAAAPWATRASAVVTLAAIVLWGAHLLRGLPAYAGEHAHKKKKTPTVR